MNTGNISEEAQGAETAVKKVNGVNNHFNNSIMDTKEINENNYFAYVRNAEEYLETKTILLLHQVFMLDEYLEPYDMVKILEKNGYTKLDYEDIYNYIDNVILPREKDDVLIEKYNWIKMFIDQYALSRGSRWDNYGPITEVITNMVNMLRETGSATLNFGDEVIHFGGVENTDALLDFFKVA